MLEKLENSDSTLQGMYEICLYCHLLGFSLFRMNYGQCAPCSILQNQGKTLGRYQSHKPSFLCDKVIIFTEMTSLNIFVRLHYIFVVSRIASLIKL